MDDYRNKILTRTTLMTAAGLGLLIVVANKRKHIFHFMKNLNNPLSHRQIEVIQTVDDCQRVVNILKK